MKKQVIILSILISLIKLQDSVGVNNNPNSLEKKTSQPIKEENSENNNQEKKNPPLKLKIPEIPKNPSKKNLEEKKEEGNTEYLKLSDEEKKQMKKEINNQFAQHQKKNKIKKIDDLIILDSDNKKIELGKFYNLKKNGELKIPSSFKEKMLILKISGMGIIDLSIKNNVNNIIENPNDDNDKKNTKITSNDTDLKNTQDGDNNENIKKVESEIISQTLFINENHTNHIIPISTTLLKGENLVLSLTNKNMYNSSRMVVYINFGNDLLMAFNDSVKFTTKYIRDINIMVEDFFGFSKAKNNRIEFVLQTSLQNQEIKGDEIVKMFINKKNEFPDEKNFDFAPFGNIGKGLIKTLNENSPFFCKEDNCVYHISLFLENIDFVYFYPSFSPNFSEFELTNELDIIEAIEKNETLTYVLNLKNKKNSWIFNINPFENDTDFYINPNILPEKLEDYKYKAISDGEEEFLITNSELNPKNSKVVEKLFITFQAKNNKDTSFMFSANTISNKLYINEDVLETGLIKENQLVNYFFDLSSSEKTLYTLKFKLISLIGNSDLYIKECKKGEKNCKITKEDIEFSYFPEDIDFFQNRIFRFSRIDISSKDKTTFDEILMNFNCLNSLTPNQKGIYPFSETCFFAVGVYNRGLKKIYNKKDLTIEEKMKDIVEEEANDKIKESSYSLKVTGQEIIHPIPFWESASVTVNEKSRLLIHLEKDSEFFQNNLDQKKTLSLKIVSVTGNCNIYISTHSTNPDYEDNDLEINFNREENLELKTIVKKMTLDIEDDNKNSIYILIEADTYSLIDIYPSLSSSLKPYLPENLLMDNLVNRSITRDNNYKIDSDFYYFENFVFKLPKNFLDKESLDITVNSQVLGLEICVQFNKDDFDFDNKCDKKSDSEILEFENIKESLKDINQFVIQIRKKIDSKTIFTRFPINYSLVINSSINSQLLKKKIKLAKPGEVHTKKISPKSHQLYEINLPQIKKNSYVTFTTEELGIIAYIKNSENDNDEDSIAWLDKFNFGFYITDLYLFKTEYWNKDGSNSLFISVFNSGDEKGRFSLTFIYDDIPIYLKDGNSFYIPSGRKSYFISEVEKDTEFNCDFDSEVIKFETFSTVFNSVDDSRDITKVVNKDHFDFKTTEGKLGEIVIPTLTLLKHELPKIAILYNPIIEEKKISDFDKLYQKTHPDKKKTKKDTKSNKKNVSESSFRVLSQNEKTTVSTHSSIKKLLPYNLLQDSGMRGEFKYYYFTVDSMKTSILISLSITSGESDLYINKGMYNFPTTDNYWKKSATYKGDEIEINSKMFKNDYDYIGTFTVGVYSREFSRFNLVVSPSFGNLLNIKYQNLLELNIKGGQYYYFDYNNNLERFNTFLFSEDSDVFVDAFDFDEGKGHNLADLLENDKNYKNGFIYRKNNPPSKMFLKDVNKLKSHFILRMKSNSDTKILFLIYNPKEPIEIFSDKRFDFVLDELEEQVFVVRLDSDYKNVDVDIKLNFGEIEFAVNDFEKFEKFESLTKPDQKYVQYFKDEDSSNKDIVTFNEVYIKVKSKKLSSFSVLVKPKDKFKRLRKFENEIIYTSKTEDQYIYFEVSEKEKKKWKSLIFNIYMIKSYNEKPELYFVPDLEFSLNKKSPFVPMPLIDYSSKDYEQFLNLIIKPQLSEGVYIFKIKKHYDEVPIKISVSMNDEKVIELNSVQKNLLPGGKNKKHVFKMYIPEEGEFRIVLEGCKNVEIENIVFLEQHSGKEKTLAFKNNQPESFKYVFFDATNENSTFDFEKKQFLEKDIDINVKRNFVNKPGIIKFTVGLTKNNRSGMFFDKRRNDFYEVLTEFRPKKKQMNFKDYVVLNTDIKRPRFHYKFFKNNTKLNILTRLPYFKDQLFVDYPNIKKIEISMFIYIFEDDNKTFSNDIKKCGSTTVSNNKKLITKKEKIIIPIEQINKETVITNHLTRRDLNNFRKNKHFSVFERLDITFIENEKDEFNITLDRKFLSIPYFLIIIPNENKQDNLFRFFLASLKLLMISIIFLIFAIFYLLYKRQKNKKSFKNIYQQENSEIQNIENSKDDLDFDRFVSKGDVIKEEKEVREISIEDSVSSEETEEKQYSYEI